MDCKRGPGKVHEAALTSVMSCTTWPFSWS